MQKTHHFVLSTICLLVGISTALAQPYSDPKAPVGNKKLTMSPHIKPIMDYWMRDTYVMLGPDGYYYMTGTTAIMSRQYPTQVHCWDYNDGFYLWRSTDLKNWEARGQIFEYTPDKWQSKGKPIKENVKSLNGDPLDSLYRAAWAPELHYIKSKNQWLLVGCQNGGAGSFIMKSTSGKPEGPYENIPGNKDKAIFKNIDLSVFEDDNGDVYAVGHNHWIAKMKDDLSDIAEPFKQLKETPYPNEPYIEGVFITKYKGKYQLLQTVWSVKKPDGSYTFETDGDKTQRHSYDLVVAESDNVYGPYSPRYPAVMEGGHNNLFQDKTGKWWSTTFFNPRGFMGTQYKVTCRPALVPVMWKKGKLMPDNKRAKKFYK